MRCPPHVTDTVYRYDGSFPGFLCCVFASYARHELPAAVCGPQDGQTSLFGSVDIATQAARAHRVAAGLGRLGTAVKERVSVGFLSTEPGKDLALLRFARLCFDDGPAAARRLGDPDVAAAFALERAVNNEANKFIEFLRFEQRGTMLGAVIHPKNNVLPLLRPHFCSRLPDEDFLIFDATHGMALLRQGGAVRYLAMERYAPAPDEAEAQWQALWKRFFHALAIESRRDPKGQMGHAPKRYWRDMCEMWPDLAGPGQEAPHGGGAAKAGYPLGRSPL